MVSVSTDDIYLWRSGIHGRAVVLDPPRLYSVMWAGRTTHLWRLSTWCCIIYNCFRRVALLWIVGQYVAGINNCQLISHLCLNGRSHREQALFNNDTHTFTEAQQSTEAESNLITKTAEPCRWNGMSRIMCWWNKETKLHWEQLLFAAWNQSNEKQNDTK